MARRASLRPGRRALALAAAALVAAACAGPAPKRGGRTVLLEGDAKPEKASRSPLLTPAGDARVGAEAARQVAAQVGLYDDPALTAYVDGIGRKLLRSVPRRPFSFHFLIVDQWEPNAFSLPGGYIYVSRGLLALVNDEDELANVLGHEITHTLRRHAAQQQTLAAQQSVLSMPMMRMAQLRSYGRDMEREADQGGQILAAAAGYDPMGMPHFLSALGQNERLVLGRPRVPTWLDTHPGTTERVGSTSFRAHEIRWTRAPGLGDTRAALLRHTDGLALGDRPEVGLFQGDLFVQPVLDFEILFPHGWQTLNAASQVGAASPKGDAFVYLEMAPGKGDAEEAARRFVDEAPRQAGLEVRSSKPVKLGRIPAVRLEIEANRAGANVIATFFSYRGATWRIIGASRSLAGSRYQAILLATARSFRPLQPGRLGAIFETRMAVVEARAGESFEALDRRTGNSWEPLPTAVLNGMQTSDTFTAGYLVKIARTQRWQPPH